MKFKHLSLEITNRCRLACSKCSRTIMGKKMAIRDIDVEDIRKIAESRTYTNIFFGGTYGDCIYHPKFYEIVKLFKNTNHTINIHTNGSGKSINWWNDIFKLLDNKDIINIAMDGYKETVGIYRENFKEKDFEKNIEIFKLASQYGIKTEWTFIPFSFNEHQIFDAAVLAIKHNIVFCIKKSARWHEIKDPLMPKNINLISDETKARLNIFSQEEK